MTARGRVSHVLPINALFCSRSDSAYQTRYGMFTIRSLGSGLLVLVWWLVWWCHIFWSTLMAHCSFWRWKGALLGHWAIDWGLRLVCQCHLFLWVWDRFLIWAVLVLEEHAFPHLGGAYKAVMTQERLTSPLIGWNQSSQEPRCYKWGDVRALSAVASAHFSRSGTSERGHS